MAPRKLLFGMALFSLLCTACGRHRVVGVPVPPSPSTAAQEKQHAKPGETSTSAEREKSPLSRYTEVGYASWYGDPYHGRRAANGEIYDKNKLTAAHLTLPFGTQVKVTDLENNRSIVVRITDRGPFVQGRIIDLSLAGARAIQMVGPGTALVRLEILSMPSQPDLGEFAVQVGAFRDRSSAEHLRERLTRRYGNIMIQNYESGDGALYRVRVGPQPSLSQASRLASRLGGENLPAFVVRVDN